MRTALHTDAGDLPQDSVVLVVLEEGEYSGGYADFHNGEYVDVERWRFPWYGCS